MPPLELGAYIEAYYQLHFQSPENRVTNLRAFDNRSRTFTVANTVVEVKGEEGPLAARIALQFGSTPTAYYNPADDEWKHVQAAVVTAKAPQNITVEAGLLPSPIGPEVFAIKDNWNWSRSNLFVGLPFYHTGVTASHPLGDAGWSAKLHVYNGWNTVVDNNATPSIAASASFTDERTTAQLLYFGGIERDDWRHLLDAYVTHAVTGALSLGAHADAGLDTDAHWLAGAVYARYAVGKSLFVAARGDAFYEDSEVPIFWPTDWVAAGTATLEYRPTANLSLRLEYRHDHADDKVYFGGEVALDPEMSPVPDRQSQDTITAGITAWL
jgi:Putative beta-barrel porin-2, OmpL-like. bbp2